MQNYQNHRRLYPLHHFILTPLTAGLLVWAVINLFKSDAANLNQQLFNVFTALALVMAVLISRIYALKNQDRIIKTEVRMRYFELTGKSFKEKEEKLRTGQIIALRFADDAEFLDLVEKAIANNLSAKEIKMAVKNWKADYRRV